MRNLLLTGLALALLAPAGALAQDDAVSFGHTVRVGAGQVVRDAVSFGGDTVVAGTVTGDATSFGGSVVLERGARVEGDTTAFGGEVIDHRDGPRESAGTGVASRNDHERGPIDGALHWVKETAKSALAHVLMFLLGLFMIGVTRDRLGALQVTMIKDTAKTAGWGLLGYVVAVVAAVVFAITLVGIPVTVLIALALPVATYVGLAAAATVIGASLPLAELKGKEVLQLGAGVGVLFVASLVPFFGGIATAIAACLGFGALLRTRLAPTPPADLPEGAVGVV